jgi:uncharacterized protein YjiS (DUF1127 family)
MAIARTETRFVRSVTFGRAPGLLALIVEWDARYRARRALADLCATRRADLGLTVDDIARETAKPLWRP